MRAPFVAAIVLAVLGAGIWGAIAFLSADPVAEDPARRDAGSARDEEVQHERLPEPDVERRGEASPAPPRTEPEPSTEPAEGRFPAELRGRLVERDGSPVAGLEVQLSSLHRFAVEGTGLDLESLLADEAGIFVGRAVSAADGIFRMRARDRRGPLVLGVDVGGTRTTARWVDVPLSADREQDLGDVVLAPVLLRRGRVVDAEGRPLRRARVRSTGLPAWIFGGVLPRVGARDLWFVRSGAGTTPLVQAVPSAWSEWEARLPVAVATTDEDGRFELADAEREGSVLLVDHAGHAGGVFGPFSPERTELGELVLGSGRAITGVVVDEQGAPMPSVEVAAGGELPLAGLGLLHRAEPTAADGGFRVPAVEGEGPYWVAVRRDRGSAWQLQGPFGFARDLRVELPRGCTLRVELVDRAGRAVSGAQVQLRRRRAFESGWRGRLAGGDAFESTLLEVEDGVYEQSGLAAGAYDLLAQRGGLLATQGLRLEDEGRALRVSMLEVPRLLVEVVDADGAAVAGAQVRARVGGQPWRVGDAAITDAAGRCRVAPRAAGEIPDLILEVRHADHGRHEEVLRSDAWPRIGQPHVVRMAPPASLIGRVRRAGARLRSPVWVVVDRPDGAGSLPLFTTTDAEGSFRFDGLGRGSHRWRVLPDLGEQELWTALASQPLVPGPDSPRPLASGSVQVTPPETFLDIGLESDAEPTAALEAQVLCRHPWSVPLWFELEGPSVVRTTMLADEWLRRSGLLPGQYVARISLPRTDDQPLGGPVLLEESFELLPNETHRLQTRLELMDVRLIVVDAGGRRVAGAWCRLSREGTPPVERLADGRGEVTIPVAQRGTWIVRAYHASHGAALLAVEVPTGGAERVALDPGVPCAGVAQPPEGLGTNLLLLVQPVDGGDGRSTRLGPEGEFEVLGLRGGTYEATLVDQASGRRFTTRFLLPESGSQVLRLSF